MNDRVLTIIAKTYRLGQQHVNCIKLIDVIINFVFLFPFLHIHNTILQFFIRNILVPQVLWLHYLLARSLFLQIFVCLHG